MNSNYRRKLPKNFLQRSLLLIFGLLLANMMMRCQVHWKNLFALVVVGSLLLQIFIKSMIQRISFYHYNAILIIVATMKTFGISAHHAMVPFSIITFLSFLHRTLSTLQCAKTIPPN